MICIELYRNAKNEIYKVKALNHGKSIVCAAVSILVLNTVNSIESFTDEHFIVNYEEEGGYLVLTLPAVEKGEDNHDVHLLLNSLALGLNGIKKEHSDQIRILDKEV